MHMDQFKHLNLRSCSSSVRASCHGVVPVHMQEEAVQVTSSSRLLKYSNSNGTPLLEAAATWSTNSPTGSRRRSPAASATPETGDGFSTMYKGQLRGRQVVVVKRLYNNSCRNVEQFVNQAAILSRLRHLNLVIFYGYTSSRSRELLEYEYMPNNTVADHLHGHHAAEIPLSWSLCLNVVVEAAAALAYLHAIEPPAVHRDEKITNILLDSDFHVKVADFGLSRLFPLDGATHVSTTPQGTPGYCGPGVPPLPSLSVAQGKE